MTKLLMGKGLDDSSIKKIIMNPRNKDTPQKCRCKKTCISAGYIYFLIIESEIGINWFFLFY